MALKVMQRTRICATHTHTEGYSLICPWAHAHTHTHNIPTQPETGKRLWRGNNSPFDTSNSSEDKRGVKHQHTAARRGKEHTHTHTRIKTHTCACCNDIATPLFVTKKDWPSLSSVCLCELAKGGLYVWTPTLPLGRWQGGKDKRSRRGGEGREGGQQLKRTLVRGETADTRGGSASYSYSHSHTSISYLLVTRVNWSWQIEKTNNGPSVKFPAFDYFIILCFHRK